MTEIYERDVRKFDLKFKMQSLKTQFRHLKFLSERVFTTHFSFVVFFLRNETSVREHDLGGTTSIWQQNAFISHRCAPHLGRLATKGILLNT